MAPASKEAPFVFEFIANKESHKFDEIEAHSEVNVSVYNTKLVHLLLPAAETIRARD